MYDWKLAIATNFWQRQQAEIWDPQHLFPMKGPKVRASEEAIAQAEEATAFLFSQDYKDFLRHADGWPAFCENMDIFGTSDFLSGEVKRLVERHAAAIRFMSTLGLDSNDYLAVGGNRNGLDLFLLISANCRNSPGQVIWYKDDEVDRCPSFGEFFSSMIALNEWLAQEGAKDPRNKNNPAKRYPPGYQPTEFRWEDK